MEKQQWNGEELYKYDGRFVFIIETYTILRIIEIADFETGKIEKIEYQDLIPATPEELEEIV